MRKVLHTFIGLSFACASIACGGDVYYEDVALHRDGLIGQIEIDPENADIENYYKVEYDWTGDPKVVTYHRNHVPYRGPAGWVSAHIETEFGGDWRLTFKDERGQATQDNSFRIHALRFESISNDTGIFRYLTEANLPAKSPHTEAYGERITFNAAGQLMTRTYVDRADQPVIGKAPMHATREVVRNEKGWITQRRTLDLDGTPVAPPEISVVRIEYNDRGLITGREQFDAEGNARGDCHRIALEYEGLNRKREACYNEDGSPAEQPGDPGVFAYEYDHNDHGYLIETRALDREGNLTNSRRKGGHRITREYDSNGFHTDTSYFGAGDRPIALPNSRAHHIQYSFNEHYLQLEQACLDATEQPTPCPGDSWSRQVFEYADDGRTRTTELYLDGDGESVLTRGGYAIVRYQFDDAGRLTEITHFGPDETPVLTSAGFHREEHEYTDDGFLEAVRYYGIEGEAVLKDNRFHRVAFRELSSSGAPTKTELVGVNNESYSGCHVNRLTHDDLGDIVERSYFDQDGAPCKVVTGFYVERITYDTRGNVVEERHFDAMDRPVTLGNTNIHRIAYEYYPHGRVRERSYFDVDGDPALEPGGAWRQVIEYDSSGDATAVIVYGPAGNELRRFAP